MVVVVKRKHIKSIGIIDYGYGNLTSVSGAVEHLGFKSVVSADPFRLEQCDSLILPGVGSFSAGMKGLAEGSLIEMLNSQVLEHRKPFLGICLGAQLIAEESNEFGVTNGLGWVPASVNLLKPANPDLRVPHVGWNALNQVRSSILFDGIPDDALFYFVHSYHIVMKDPELVTGTCDFDSPITAAFEKDNIFAAQFHPEKSQMLGLTFLRNFLEKA